MRVSHIVAIAVSVGVALAVIIGAMVYAFAPRPGPRSATHALPGPRSAHPARHSLPDDPERVLCVLLCGSKFKTYLSTIGSDAQMICLAVCKMFHDIEAVDMDSDAEKRWESGKRFVLYSTAEDWIPDQFKGKTIRVCKSEVHKIIELAHFIPIDIDEKAKETLMKYTDIQGPHLELRMLAVHMALFARVNEISDTDPPGCAPPKTVVKTITRVLFESGAVAKDTIGESVDPSSSLIPNEDNVSDIAMQEISALLASTYDLLSYQIRGVLKYGHFAIDATMLTNYYKTLITGRGSNKPFLEVIEKRFALLKAKIDDGAR